ncbi:MAG: HAD family phosphatase [Eubacteriales bacterium]|nr:HAD family phosphatase [Eubacteriales bacterium]MDD3880670.1 HAD family phosphatase [Eubacteriales bacterium]MDD4511696.1 HAD family phosphatase [Eubacteriales bacterium]
MAEQIRNIVFDVGRVLLTFDERRIAHGSVSNDGDALELSKVTILSPEWKMLDRGTITFEEAKRVWKSRCPKLSGAIDDMTDNWHFRMEPIMPMWELAGELKSAGMKLYVLSNYSTRFWVCRDMWSIFDLMDGFIVSSELSLMKPEKEIFKALYDKYEIKPSESFFIDDRLENTIGAEETGMRAFCFSGDVSALRSALRELSVPIK